MENRTYKELLLDPRWQKKRLKILERDNWRCRCCEKPDQTLHVHHMYYTKGAVPWDYADESLITLCYRCHEDVKKYNWQKAFIHLNLTPKQLLELALMTKHMLTKMDKFLKEEGSKHPFNPSWWYADAWVKCVTQEELDDFYRSFKPEHIKDFINE